MDADSYGKNLCCAPKKNSKMCAASRTCLARVLAGHVTGLLHQNVVKKLKRVK